jgi:putative endonuclease
MAQPWKTALRSMVPGVALSEAGPVDTMHYVYLLRSLSHPTQTYVGYSGDLKKRLLMHNAGDSSHTRKYPPWRLVTYLTFSEKSRALEFERYLKSHSGNINVP